MMRLAKKQIEPGIVVLEVTGRIVMGPDCQQIDREVEAHILRGEKSFIFDLTAVDHVDSAAVGQIVKCYTKLKKSGGTLRLAGVHGMVEGVLKLTQVHKVIEIFPTAQEAAKDFPRAQ
jgi:anti-sigma B factor antagonist